MKTIKIKENINFSKLEKLGFEKRYSCYTGELSSYEHPEEGMEILIYNGKATELVIDEKDLDMSKVILLIEMYKEKLIEIFKEKDERMSNLEEIFIKKGQMNNENEEM